MHLEELRRIVLNQIPTADVRMDQCGDCLRVYCGKWIGCVTHFPRDGDKYGVMVIDSSKDGDIPCVTATPNVDELHDNEESAAIRLASLLRV
jgi:hypothetical protein